ncbi:3-hydroxyisobutyrate dehydrogenase-like beta-hydroxyacid dehydrogenase [Secundilactobacillus kimchicus JCM 15530]|uniref:3-hydroxyisobutyrate dehydrogenase-like beta-hydroxyacid dehydrogenase n=1 Tax=Secundilactobacillus kimchicus JCM 15530 TaxID=1302272 RepID=A0A0R1HLZ9_9LACO|nr:3-hydroxyisobutyrate dehydrogenase-like beta-hydroxyacid dehydrogenase [Secundilactobacillus kimchicus JCM 15530]
MRGISIMNITFIGTGFMGSEMVPHLVANGYTVTVFDRDSDKTRRLASDQIHVAHSLEEAVRASSIIITSVMSTDVLDLHLGTGNQSGIVHFLNPDSILIVTSTLDPEKIATIKAAMPAQTKLLDAPIIGGVRYAREGSLVLIPAGDKTAYESAKPVLETFGHVEYVGKSGNGAKLKLITNVGIMAAEAGIRETLDLADVYDIDYDTTLHLMQLGPLKPVVTRALDENNPRPLKDSVADEVELLSATDKLVELPMVKASMRRLQMAVDAVEGEARFSDITHKNTSLKK